MSDERRVFRARRVVTPAGVRPAAIHVRHGAIEAVTGPDDGGRDAVVIDFGDAVVLPGLVDTHVHVNDPGRTDWEGFESATLAAAAGGVTTLVDMPLNSIPATTTPAALAAKLTAAEGRRAVDVAFWGGLVPDNANAAALRPLAAAGVLGFKCFLVPSGVPEFEHVGEAELRAALPVLAELGLPLLAHAELPGPIAAATPSSGDPRRYARYLASRPPEAELAAIELLIRLARESGAHVHIVHVSTAEALPLLDDARAAGVRISAETCPHYLYFAADRVPDGATEFKCAPPIRDAANRERLWTGLASGALDLVASDHSPCPAALKLRESGDFERAWGGIASLQLTLPIVWTAAGRRGYDVADLARWLALAPARLAGLDGRKGAIAAGRDADLVAFEPAAQWIVRPEQLRHRHTLTPYAGEALTGRVIATYLRGEKIFEDGAPVATRNGRTIMREGAPWTSPT
jgi:allantoinase